MKVIKEYNAVRERIISASSYLQEINSPSKAENIEKIEFIPPKIGKRGYGKFKIRYKTLMAVEA